MVMQIGMNCARDKGDRHQNIVRRPTYAERARLVSEVWQCSASVRGDRRSPLQSIQTIFMVSMRELGR